MYFTLESFLSLTLCLLELTIADIFKVGDIFPRSRRSRLSLSRTQLHVLLCSMAEVDKKDDKSSDFFAFLQMHLVSAFMSTTESVDASESAEMASAAQQPV